MSGARKMYCYNSGWGQEFLWACGSLTRIHKICLGFSEEVDSKYQISKNRKLPGDMYQEPFPRLDELGELATSSIKNLYSALDHSMTFLREISDGTSMISNSENAFPICQTASDFSKAKKRLLKGIDGSFVMQIESVQPFSQPSISKMHPLEFLKSARHLISHRASISCLNPLNCDLNQGKVHVTYIDDQYFWEPMIQLDDSSIHRTYNSIRLAVDFLWDHIFNTNFFGTKWDQIPRHMIGQNMQFNSSTQRLF